MAYVQWTDQVLSSRVVGGFAGYFAFSFDDPGKGFEHYWEKNGDE